MLAVAAVLLLYQFYEMLSPEFHIEVVDLYMERVAEKTEDFMRGDMASATTNRNVIFSKYISYIFTEQDISATLFGGNSLIIPSVTSSAPHNTYVGILLQFGVVGFVLFVAYALKKLWNAFKRKEDPNRHAILILKVLCLFFAITLSFYASSTYALWMMIILLL